jgi:phage-related protein
MGGEAGGNLGDILKKLAQFAAEFVKAAGPLAGLSFAALGLLADALNAIPMSVLEILAPMIMGIVLAMKAWRLATLAFAASQALLNIVMATAPWVLITLAIIAIVVALVSLWKKNEGFRKFIIGAWQQIKNAFVVAWEWIRDKVFAPIGRFFTETIPRWATTLKNKVTGAWNSIKEYVGKALNFLKNLFLNWTGPGLIIKHWDKIRGAAGKAIDWIRKKFNDFIGFVVELPGRIGRGTANMFNGVKSAFKSAINWVIGKWNNFEFRIGGGSFMGVDIPKVTVGTPNIPYLARGGIGSGLAMVGERGRELVDLPAGSRVRSNPDTERIMSRGKGGMAPFVVVLKVGDKSLGEVIIDPLRKAVQTRGGNVQAVLGR